MEPEELDVAQAEQVVEDRRVSLLDTKPLEINLDEVSIGTMRKLEAMTAGIRSKTPLNDIILVLADALENWTIDELDSLKAYELEDMANRVQETLRGFVPKANAASSSPPSHRMARGRPAGRRR